MTVNISDVIIKKDHFSNGDGNRIGDYDCDFIKGINYREYKKWMQYDNMSIQLLIINVVNSANIIVREREKRGEGKDANIEKDRQ